MRPSMFALLLLAGCTAFTWENDFGAPLNRDRHYSNGIEFERAADGGERRFALGHRIFTPDNVRTAELVEDDRPYAGYLYGRAEQDVIRDHETVDTYALELGLVGPSAQGEWVQNEFHELIENKLVEGWNNQLRDEPTVRLGYRQTIYGWSEAWKMLPVSTEAYYGASVGNLFTGSELGVRIVRARQYGDLRVEMFSGLEGRLVARDLLLEGNTWKDSHGVDAEPLVAVALAGVAVQWGRAFVAYTYRLITDEFAEQDGGHNYGSLQFGVRG